MSLFVLLPLMGAADHSSFGTNTMREISIYLNDRKLDLKTMPIVRSGVVYVPMIELAAELRFYYQRFNGEAAVLYKNNLFVKVLKDSDTAYVNGAEVPLAGPVFEEENRLYLPISLIASALDFERRWDPATGDFRMVSGDAGYKFAFFKDSFYKKIFVDAYGVNISVPIHWDKINSERQSYGFIDSFEQFSVEVVAERQAPGVTLEDWQALRFESVQKAGTVLIGEIGVDTMTSTRIDSHSLEYSVRQGPETLQHIDYLFLQGNIGYSLLFSYNSYIDPAYAKNIIKNVAESFQVDMLTIRESEEHYVEYRNFFEYGITLEHELYSNQLAFNTQRFEGTLANPDGVTQFLITVSKGTDRLEFIVPVKDGKFSTRIYLPFGLGKHNILIETLDKNGFIFEAKRDLNFEPRINYHRDNVMQFSLINTSGDKIRYLVPTARIPADHEQITSVSNLLTYKELTQYGKARALYLWIMENIELDGAMAPFSRNALEVFEQEIGTEEEIGLLYASFLRAIGIPAKITTGEGAAQQHLWVEVFINGEWRVMDIGHEFSTPSQGLPLKYFWLDRETFYADYENIKSLNE
ncbi:transglutaminase domain-containing protein [Acidaminobacter hydrogenoformans]|nr:transglutaminase domain-containing protein [Acidaminobacter hydrogenoformans]